MDARLQATPGYSGKQYRSVAALGLTAVSATPVLEGGMTGDGFDAYAEYVYAPTLYPRDVVLIEKRFAHCGYLNPSCHLTNS
jgi:hypothetical protein